MTAATTSASASPSVITARGVSVERGGSLVLDALDFEVGPGAVVGLLGPSGCGKSTLMRSIVGVQRNVSGELLVLGLPAGTPRLRSRVSYVTQAPSVYEDLTVEQNVEALAGILGESGARVREVIDAVDLTEHADRVVRGLSGGERSRVSIAGALLGRPDLLILDEPTVGLDPVLRRDLWKLFAGFARNGTTLLVSSHVMDEADRCESLLLMRDGRLLAQLTPSQLRERTGQDRLEDAFLELIERSSPTTPDEAGAA
jgi:ABC-2 type transport system ATP-binding protein